MLYRIARGGVAQYQHGQTALVYLVTTIDDVHRSGLRWVFSNGNCGALTTEHFNDLQLLDVKVDWDPARGSHVELHRRRPGPGDPTRC